MDYGVNAPVPTLEEAERYPYTDADRQRIAHHRRRVVLGTPDGRQTRLLEIQAEFDADELMVITITGDYDTRLRSYELVAAGVRSVSAGCSRRRVNGSHRAVPAYKGCPRSRS